MCNVSGAAVAVDLDVAQEDVLELLGNVGLILRGHDEARAHAVAAYVLLAVLQRDGRREHVHAGLAARVGGRAQVARDRSHGADVHDRAATCLDHVGKHCLYRIERPAHARGEHRVPILERNLVHAPVLQSHARGVVDQDVGAAAVARRIREEGVHRGEVRQVHAVEAYTAALGHDTVHHLLAARLASAAHHDVRALRGKLPRDADPDAAGRARDHRDLALEPVHVASLCGSMPATAWRRATFAADGKIPPVRK